MNSTIVGLVAAIAVLSGGLGFSMTGVFDDQNLITSNLPATGFLMGQVEIEARNADGEIIAYRLSDNEVVDDGEQCILKMLFATAQTATVGRGEYVTDGSGACTGILTGAWNVIAIGTNNDSGNYVAGRTAAQDDVLVRLGNETSTTGGLERSMASTITWTNGTGSTTTKIVLANTFTSTSPITHAIGESGLFNSTTWVADRGGMLARQTFTDVSLATGDSITVTWTFTVGN
jgi:hypothetical protein